MKKDVNRRIIESRARIHLTQNGMADKLNIKRSTYAYLESKGDPTPEQLKQIAAVLGVTTDYLLYGMEQAVIQPIVNVARETEVEYRRPQDTLELTADEKKLLKMLRMLPKSSRTDYIRQITDEYKSIKETED